MCHKHKKWTRSGFCWVFLCTVMKSRTKSLLQLQTAGSTTLPLHWLFCLTLTSLISPIKALIVVHPARFSINISHFFFIYIRLKWQDCVYGPTLSLLAACPIFSLTFICLKGLTKCLSKPVMFIFFPDLIVSSLVACPSSPFSPNEHIPRALFWHLQEKHALVSHRVISNR